jgi:hypothetical protein
MDAELEMDIDDLPPKVLRKMLRQMMAKKNKPRSEMEDGEEDKAEDEREALADLHAEHKGKGPEIPVTDEDLPESLRGDSEEEEPKKKGSEKRSK